MQLSLKERANAILVVSAIVYGLVCFSRPEEPPFWYEALYWITQSALIGSVADWFAVTALFKKPLGFPYHTVLIPRHKEKISNGIVSMVTSKLVTPARWAELIGSVELVPLLDRYMQSEAGKERWHNWITEGCESILSKPMPETWVNYLEMMIRQKTMNYSIVPPVKAGLQSFITSEAGTDTLIEWARWGRMQCQRPDVRQWLEETLREVVETHKEGTVSHVLVSISEELDVINVEELASIIISHVHQMLEEWEDTNSEGHRLLMQEIERIITHLDAEDGWGEILKDSYLEVMKSISWYAMIQLYIWPACQTMEGLVERLEELVYSVWNDVKTDETMRAALEAAGHRVLISLADRGHQWIGVIILRVLADFSTERFNEFIESKVEDDLSWIRINGALVGGAIGLGVWGFLQFIYNPLLQIIQ